MCNASLTGTALPLPVNYSARNKRGTMEELARGWLLVNRMHTTTNGGGSLQSRVVRWDQVPIWIPLYPFHPLRLHYFSFFMFAQLEVLDSRIPVIVFSSFYGRMQYLTHKYYMSLYVFTSFDWLFRLQYGRPALCNESLLLFRCWITEPTYVICAHSIKRTCFDVLWR